MKYKIYNSNAGSFKRRRRRIGELTREIRQFKQTLTASELIGLEVKTLKI